MKADRPCVLGLEGRDERCETRANNLAERRQSEEKGI